MDIRNRELFSAMANADCNINFKQIREGCWESDQVFQINGSLNSKINLYLVDLDDKIELIGTDSEQDYDRGDFIREIAVADADDYEQIRNLISSAVAIGELLKF